MLFRAIRLGSTVFLVLFGCAAGAIAAAYWYHRTVVGAALSDTHQGGVEAEQVHTDVVFVFSASPLSLAFGAAIVWLLCVGFSYAWLAIGRRPPAR